MGIKSAIRRLFGLGVSGEEQDAFDSVPPPNVAIGRGKGTTDSVRKGFFGRSGNLGVVAKGHCPDCGSKNCMLSGPSGGMCQNVMCEKCGKKFNITPFGVERI